MYNEQQQQQANGFVQDKITFPLVQDGNNGNMIAELTDNRQMLREYEAYLKGQVLDDNGNYVGPVVKKYIEIEDSTGKKHIKEVLETVGNPVLSEWGSTKVMSILNILGNRGAFSGPTDKKEVEIGQIHYYIMRAVMQLILTHAEEMGINSSTEATIIKESISSFVKLCLNRTREGGERAGWRETTRVNQTVTGIPNGKLQGYIERFRQRSY